ncbi:hypothetical protein E2C01_045717 [Portunus trituberculatus]|uniref:Uncharacterized protein n=1 Tax=Portunus trituberculatus TaxID=210409 RepID=A0A5B7G3R4_PORTR|nr:hypothetical protein [Portunus trituberculatus]
MTMFSSLMFQGLAPTWEPRSDGRCNRLTSPELQNPKPSTSLKTDCHLTILKYNLRQRYTKEEHQQKLHKKHDRSSGLRLAARP